MHAKVDEFFGLVWGAIPHNYPMIVEQVIVQLDIWAHQIVNLFEPSDDWK